MSLITRNQRCVWSIRENRIDVPNVQVSVVHRPSNHAPRLLGRDIAPRKTVEPARTRQSKPKEREKDFRSVANFALGASSKAAGSALSRPRSHISSSLSWEKLASTAPAIVPEAMSGLPRAGLQANVALRVICFNWTIAGHGSGGCCCCEKLVMWLAPLKFQFNLKVASKSRARVARSAWNSPTDYLRQREKCISATVEACLLV